MKRQSAPELGVYQPKETMKPDYNKHPILNSFDQMLENLPKLLKWPLSADCKLQFHVTTPYYQQLLQVEHTDLLKSVAPTNMMSYKDCPIYMDDKISSITLSPLPVAEETAVSSFN